MLGHGEPLRVRQGQRVLMRLLNASPTENVILALAGHRLNVIALDGNPMPSPKSAESLFLAPAERADVVVEMNRRMDSRVHQGGRSRLDALTSQRRGSDYRIFEINKLGRIKGPARRITCENDEEAIRTPAPFHVTPRGFAGPQLLAMILFEKFGQHQPLNRQSERYRREGIDLSVSTLADRVGACTTVLQPLHALIERHVLAAERLHGDDTTVPILAKGKTIKGHIWTYVRDDRPFGGRAPPAALYYASRDRRHEHPTRHLHGFNGILQADAYSGYNELYDPSRTQGPITAALCWAHTRRQFFELADIAANARRGKKAAAISPIALEAVKRIDALFDIERGINGQSAKECLRVRKQQSAPLVAALEAWLREQRSRLSSASSVAGPIDYMLRRWDRFIRFLDDANARDAANPRPSPEGFVEKPPQGVRTKKPQPVAKLKVGATAGVGGSCRDAHTSADRATRWFCGAPVHAPQKPGDIVVMVCPHTKRRGAQNHRICRSRITLPAALLTINPIEQAFAKLKAHLRKATERSIPAL
jgi:hypothetical protein